MLTPKIVSYPQKPTEGVSTWNNGCADGRGRPIAHRCQREDVANSLNNWKNERHDGDNSSAWPYSLHVFFTVWARRLIAAMRPQAAACWPQACTATMRSASLRDWTGSPRPQAISSANPATEGASSGRQSVQIGRHIQPPGGRVGDDPCLTWRLWAGCSARRLRRRRCCPATARDSS